MGLISVQWRCFTAVNGTTPRDDCVLQLANKLDNAVEGAKREPLNVMVQVSLMRGPQSTSMVLWHLRLGL